MARRKRRRNEVIGLIGLGVGTGVGASLLSSTGTTAGASAAAGVAKVSSFAPAMGTIVGAGLTLQQINRLPLKRTRRTVRRKR